MQEIAGMRYRIGFSISGIFFLLGFVTCSSAVDLKEAVNSFYKDYFETLKSDQASLRSLAEKVQFKRDIAEKCLDLCKEKLNIQDGRADAWRHLYENLKVSIELTAEGPDCSEKTISPLVRLAIQAEKCDGSYSFCVSTIFRSGLSRRAL
jgi:hypothetical protein